MGVCIQGDQINEIIINKKKETQMKKIISYLVFSSFMSLNLILLFSTQIHAATKEQKLQLNEVDMQVVSYDENNNRSLAVVRAKHSANGDVSGNGVNLRAKPSTTSAVLELMYAAEYDTTYNHIFHMCSNRSIHIQRIKTGTYGYASVNYISGWD